MLEGGAEQHPIVVEEDVLGAVAVVHVEVEDRDPADAVRFQRVRRSGRDVVEQAKAHGR